VGQSKLHHQSHPPQQGRPGVFSLRLSLDSGKVKNLEIVGGVDGARLAKTTVPKLEKGGTYTFSFPWQAEKAGTHTVFFDIDPKNKTNDPTPKNNYFEAKFKVQEKSSVADLAIENIAVDMNRCASDGEVLLSFDAVNCGTKPLQKVVAKYQRFLDPDTWSQNCGGGTKDYTWEIQELKPSERKKLDLWVKLNACGATFHLSLDSMDLSGDPTPENNKKKVHVKCGEKVEIEY